jgi:hypothetical protein
MNRLRAALRPLDWHWERTILEAGLKNLHPMHPAVPKIVRRLADQDRAPSPIDPADSIVTGACILASLALLAFSLAGWV